jgi:hypothetical protein
MSVNTHEGVSVNTHEGVAIAHTGTTVCRHHQLLLLLLFCLLATLPECHARTKNAKLQIRLARELPLRDLAAWQVLCKLEYCVYVCVRARVCECVCV